MILYVAEAAAKAVGFEHVYVATDSKRIASVVEASGYKALMTSDRALTGTDRVAEAAEQLNYRWYINLQGDEPLVRPSDILGAAQLREDNRSQVINAYTELEEHESPSERSIPKVVINERSELLYISRAPVPFAKEGLAPKSVYLKQVCIYVFSREDLGFFRSFSNKTPLECLEDIEILRFLESGRSVKMFRAQRGSIAVDYPGDIEKVEAILRGGGLC